MSDYRLAPYATAEPPAEIQEWENKFRELWPSDKRAKNLNDPDRLYFKELKS